MSAEHSSEPSDSREGWVRLPTHAEIEAGRKDMLAQRIDALIAHLNSLKDELETPSGYRSQTMANGHVENSLHHLLSSEGPGR